MSKDFRVDTDEFKEVTVAVSFKYRHKDVTKRTLREYIKDALHGWGGQFDPGEFEGNEDGEPARDSDPLFYGIRRIKVGAFHDGNPKSLLVLLQAAESNDVDSGKVRGRGGRRRKRTNGGVQPEG